jgi:hypothetical protein
MNIIEHLVIDGCANGFSGKLCDTIIKAGELQSKIIEQYERTLKFLNRVCFDAAKYYKESNRELSDFAWSTNDCIVDMPDVYKMKQELEDLLKRNFKG